MNVYFEPRKLRLDASAVAIGMFDGVHLGHRHVLAKLRERGDALGVPTVLITFDPHPRSVVRENGAPPMLCRLPERLQLLQDRKSTRLNSSHHSISYAVFCLKKK